jgi:hypothetical protein
MCEHCGNSGLLNIVSSREEFMPADAWDPTPYVSPCHACPRGAEMASIL